MKTFIITGVSGSGKTTICKKLKSEESILSVFDIDEDGVPENPSVEWRKERTRELIREAKNVNEAGKVAVLCGVIVPEEVRGTDQNFEAIYIFLKIDNESIKERLCARNFSEKEISDNIKWAEYLEKEVMGQKGSYILNTSAESEENTLRKVLEIIK